MLPAFKDYFTRYFSADGLPHDPKNTLNTKSKINRKVEEVVKAPLQHLDKITHTLDDLEQKREELIKKMRP